MALSVILMSDYHLARINKRFPGYSEVLKCIKSKWFKEEDLKYILSSFGIDVDSRYIDICNPLSDIVRLKCNTDNFINEKKQTWQC